MVRDWRTLTDPAPDVVVVPFFIADGLHSYEDIPVLLGLTHNIREAGFANPHVEGTRRLWYATAIGTATSMADLIVAQVEAFAVEHSQAMQRPGGNVTAPAAGFLPNAPLPWRMGQIRIEPGYELRHMDDAGRDNLIQLMSLAEIRELVRLDEAGDFRPLRASPTLRRGWRFHAPNETALREALDYFYPAEAANAELWRLENLPVAAWSETANRQTGRFRVVRDLKDDGVRELSATVCERECLKQRLWSPVAKAIDEEAGAIPLLCPEACNYFVGKARAKLKGPEAED